MNNLEQINTIQIIKTHIDDLIRQNLLDTSDTKYTLSQKIANTTLSLYLEAYRISMGKKNLLITKNGNLTLDQIKNFMLDLYRIVAQPLSADEIEDNTHQLMKIYNLHLHNIWDYANYSCGETLGERTDSFLS